MSKKMRIASLGVLIALLAIIALPNLVKAEITGNFIVGTAATIKTKPLTFTPQVGLPGFFNKPYTFNQDASTMPIALLMKSVYNYGIQIIGLLAMIVVIIGGFLWAIAGGSSQKVTEAKQWIFSGITGLILMLFSYLILRTINVNLVNFKPSEIQSVAGLNLTNLGKSDQKQAVEDYGFFDRYYSFPPIGDNPTEEACCISYNNNSASRDKAHFASMLYTAGEREKVDQQCKTFTFNLYHTGSLGTGVTKENQVARLNLYDGGRTNWSSSWTNSDYVNMQTGGKCNNVCSGVLYGIACWSDQAGSYINQGSQGKDAGSYCQNLANGTSRNGSSCLGSNSQGEKIWGYCQNQECQICLSYGQACTKDNECPDVDEKIGHSTYVANWKCGKEVSGNCKNNKCECKKACK